VHETPVEKRSSSRRERAFQGAKVVSAFVAAFGKQLFHKAPLKGLLAARAQGVPAGVSRFWAQNARLVMETGITLLFDQVQADIQMNDPGIPMNPESRESYAFNIRQGRLAMDESSVSTMINRYACPSNGPISDVQIKLYDGALRMDATLRFNRFMGVGIRIEASVAVTPSGMLQLTPTLIKSGPLPLDKILHLLGMELSRFMPANEGAPIQIQGDRILLNPVALFPAPRATGHLVEAEIKGEHLVMRYDDGSPTSEPPLVMPDAEAYIAMLGHSLHVGKTLMTDICLQLVPLDGEASWVEFSLPDYRAQLAQGESSLKPGDELLYKLPDVASLKTPASILGARLK
jgi:hypothetical protein